MRILIVGPSIKRSKGGMATVISDQLISSTINGNHKLHYIASHVDGNIKDKVFYSVKSLLHILIYQRRYDIVHFHTATGPSFYRKSLLLRLSKSLNKRAIFHMHGFDFDSFYLNSKPFFKRYIKSSLNKSDKILVLSNYWKSFFDREFTNLPVEVLQNGIDVTLYRQCIKKSTEYSEFLFLGRLGERKGTYDLLDAVDILVNSMGKRGLKFYLAGDGEIEKVRKIIKEKNLTDNVELLGWLNNDEKREILKRTDVIILPSYEEGLPMSLIEAMACGKVIISTYAGGIPDLVEHDLNGFLFNAGDVSKLVEYIAFVNENPDKMAEIGQNNINKVNKSFNLETINKQLDSIYNKL